MALYQFVDEESGVGHVLEFSMASVPSIGEVIERDGMTLRRVPSLAATAWANGQNPAKDDERRLAAHAFETPLYPGHVTGKELVKQGYPTLADSRWV